MPASQVPVPEGQELRPEQHLVPEQFLVAPVKVPSPKVLRVRLDNKILSVYRTHLSDMGISDELTGHCSTGPVDESCYFELHNTLQRKEPL